MAKKNAIKVGVINGNSKNSNSEKADVESFNRLVEEGKKRETLKNPAMIISRLDYPETVELGERKISVSPRSKLKIADKNMLKGDLPKGLFLKVLPKPKKEKVVEENE